MKNMAEAIEKNGQIYLNGWTRWLVSSLWGLLIMGMMFMANSVVANDKKYMEEIGINKTDIRELKTQFIGIKEDLTEIKFLLKRTIP